MPTNAKSKSLPNAAHLVSVASAAVSVIDAFEVRVEVNATSAREKSNTIIVGLPDKAVTESSMRIGSAIDSSGLRLPPTTNFIVNLAPADVRKQGSSYDLPIAIAMLAATGLVPPKSTDGFLFVGELGLDGSLRAIPGALPIAIKARSEGYKGLIVPIANVHEAAVVNNLEVYGAEHLSQVAKFLQGKPDVLKPTCIDTRAEFARHQSEAQLDFADVKGQEQVRRACEIAAAGGHNIILVGAPGSGKSMMAKRFPSILPPLTMRESLETTKIYSVAGLLPSGTSLIMERPFRAPHHTTSDVALIGGGATFHPGEISLAHNGVLFLDEFPEFSRSSLETLRQPLEDRIINISRAQYSATLPCSFTLVAAMNPCPCGFYNHPTKNCVCTPTRRIQYMNRISGPLLDRIDIQVEVMPVSVGDLTAAPAGESSAAIRERVIRARQIQTQRFQHLPGIHCNAQMSAKLLVEFASPDAEATQFLQNVISRLNLSARAYERILKVARTIADLAGDARVSRIHVSEAVGYRNLDREDWLL